jgi:DNA-binding MarR family transcriptional regulator
MHLLSLHYVHLHLPIRREHDRLLVEPRSMTAASVSAEKSRRRKAMTVPQRILPPEYFFYLQYHLVKQRELVLSKVLAELGLTIPKWRILSILNRLDEASMGLVADFCAIDRTTLTRTVDQLVEAGIVLRREDPLDRRQTLMSLTPTGVSAYGAAVKAVLGFNE